MNWVFFVVHPSLGEPPPAYAMRDDYAGIHALDIASLIFALFGLTGLYFAQMRRVGRSGFIAFVLAAVGTILFVGFIWGDGFYAPRLLVYAPEALDNAKDALYPGALIVASTVAALCFAVGWGVFAVLMVRAKVFSPLAAVMAGAGAIMIALPPPPLASISWNILIVGAALLAVGAAWLGIELWQKPEMADAGGAAASLTGNQSPAA